MSHRPSVDRGVSETLSFVLVFVLIIGSIGLVYTVGLGGLQDARDHERITNAERAFEVFAENQDDIVLEGAPSRSTQIRLSSATISVGDSSSIQVSGTHSDENFSYESPKYALGSLQYTSGESRVRYEGGAVIRTDAGDGGVMSREPPFVFDQDDDGNRTILQVIRLSGDDAAAISGDRVVQIRTERRLRSNDRVERRHFESVRVNVSTTTPDPWERYFEENGLECAEQTPDPELVDRTIVSCSLKDVNRHSIIVVQIDVTFE